MSWSRQLGTGGQTPRTVRFVDAARARREEFFWSRRAVAAMAERRSPGTELPETKIRDMELGRRATLTLDQAMAWAGGLGTTVKELLGEEI
jgi:hypothetical protein